MRTLRQTSRRRFVGAAASLANAASGELSTSLSRRDDDDEVTPPLLRELYNTIDYEPAAIGKNALGIAGFLDQCRARKI